MENKAVRLEDLSVVKDYIDNKNNEINVHLETRLEKDTSDSTHTQVYAKNTDGTQTVIDIAKVAGGLPRYSDDGCIDVGMPTSGTEATPKHYVDGLFNGANKSESFTDYSSMITSLNTLDDTGYAVGQNIMIVTLNVPDLWVSKIAEESVAYTYVSDDEFINELNTNGFVQVGYYSLSALETQKVDLTEYDKSETTDAKIENLKTEMNQKHMSKDAITLTLKENGAYTLTITKE